MGQFSWITQDTGEAIRESYGCSDKELTTAYMHDDKGNVWEEFEYEGYGVFGGKDFYQLLAEMNNLEGLTGDEDNDRSIGIDAAFDSYRNSSGRNPKIKYPNLTRHKKWKWINETPHSDPNQGWGNNDEEE